MDSRSAGASSSVFWGKSALTVYRFMQVVWPCYSMFLPWRLKPWLPNPPASCPYCPLASRRVADLFQSVQLNVNNPHFLIMQGRVTKVGGVFTT